MAVSIFPVSTGENWSLISSVTPTLAASTVSFTSISGYSKLLLMVKTPQLNTTGGITLTFNADSGANYAYSSIAINSVPQLQSPLISVTATGLSLGTGSTAGPLMHLEIDDVLTLGKKSLSGFMQAMVPTGVAPVYPSIVGSYFAAAAITTVTLTATSATFLASGTIALYGVKI